MPLPRRTRFLPGVLYLHDLALIGGVLTPMRSDTTRSSLDADGTWTRVWWPRCIETTRGPDFARNELQLNSIAAGPEPPARSSPPPAVRPDAGPATPTSPWTGAASCSRGRPRGRRARLTRPHSARFDDGRLWVDDSGYGEVGVIERGGFTTVARLPAWTRGF